MLELYVNYAQFVPQVYGVCAASWYYFDHSSRTLDLGELGVISANGVGHIVDRQDRWWRRELGGRDESGVFVALTRMGIETWPDLLPAKRAATPGSRLPRSNHLAGRPTG